MWRRASPPAARQPTPKEVAEVGRSTWTLLHSIAKYFPDRPTPEQRAAVAELFHSLAVLYPCRRCSAVFGLAESHQLVNPQSARELSLSLCDLHNFVNRKLGAPEVDCPALVARQLGPRGPTIGERVLALLNRFLPFSWAGGSTQY